MTPCPICGKAAYLGLVGAECSTPKCQNYVKPSLIQNTKAMSFGALAGFITSECPFSIGDIIRCVGALAHLVLGQDYTVIKLGNIYAGKRLIFVDGLPGGYFWDRFELT